jgi:acyl transferase domain-containing protein/acyl carrier protein
MTDEAQLPPCSAAIVGMSGRFPMADSISELWENLRAGRECIRIFDEAELLGAGVAPELLASPSYVRARAVLDRPGAFDAAFFGVSPREAVITDPQQRVFLTCAWEALEDAGCDPSRYEGRIGTYGGVGLSSYYRDMIRGGAGDEAEVCIANGPDFLSTRVAYKMNLRGPALTILCACSSSLVAVAVALQDLLSYRCDVALAGGVSIATPLKSGYVHRQEGILSSDGHCRVFDAEADGTVPGSGAGIVVLKRLEDAWNDGDNVLAVVRSAAINNDGSAKVGFTAPSVRRQAAVVREALALAEVPPETVSYIEAHGTGTKLGDPIEIAALSEVFRALPRQSCGIGSIKSNMGHLDAAAGVAGLIKTTLCLHHGELVPSLHYRRANPEIDFPSSPFRVVTELRPWTAPGPRRAGVSSFGIGGTNVHVVLEEAPRSSRTTPTDGDHLLPLSTKTAGALRSASLRLADHLERSADLELADAAYTLQLGRRAFPVRRCVRARTRSEAIAALRSPAPESAAVPVGNNSAVFLFAGQGSQHPNMGRRLHAESAVFRCALAECFAAFERQGIRLREALFTDGSEDEAAASLEQTVLSQPAIFALQYATARLWEAHGVRPDALLGHSIGECTAACIAGVFTLEEAAQLVAARGRLVHACPTGAMLAVHATADRLAELSPPEVALAVRSAPDLCAVSGSHSAIAALRSRLEEHGIRSVPLRTSHGFHSPSMASAAAGLVEVVAQLRPRAPRIPFLSGATGLWISEGQAVDPHYWGEQLRRPVRLAAAFEVLLEGRSRVLVDCGPGRAMSALAKRNLGSSKGHSVVASHAAAGAEPTGLANHLESLGELWTAGVALDWKALHDGNRRRKVALPTYPFDEAHHWWTPDRVASGAPRVAPLLPTDPGSWCHAPLWRPDLRPEGGAPGEARHFLIVGEDPRRCADVRALLASHSGSTRILVDGAPHTPNADPARMDLGSAEDWSAALTGWPSDSSPRSVVYVLPGNRDASHIPSELQKAAARTLEHLACMARSIDRLEGADPVPVLVVGGEIAAVHEGERVDPFAATVLGFVPSLGHELPGIRARVVDLGRGAIADLSARGRNAIVRELSSGGGPGVVALRGGQRWVRTYERLSLPAVDTQSAGLRAGGTYLVTGAFGGLGIELTRWLYERLGARLILIGRNDPPPGSRAARCVAELRALGAEMLVRTADVRDPRATSAVVLEARERFGRIDGVFHLAGVLQTRSIRALQPADIEDALAPKVVGTCALAAALADQAPDFLVLFSSLSALIGAGGRAAYAAANAFLDAFPASGLPAPACPIVVIDWDGWEVPADARTPRVASGTPRSESSRMPLLQIPQGLDVLQRILASGFSQVAVSLSELAARAHPTAGPTAPPPEGTSSRPADPPASTNGGPGGERIADGMLAMIWKDVLGVESIGPDDTFIDLGGDSLLVVEVIARLREQIDVRVEARELLFATLAQLERRIEGSSPAAPGDQRSTSREDTKTT